MYSPGDEIEQDGEQVVVISYTTIVELDGVTVSVLETGPQEG